MHWLAKHLKETTWTIIIVRALFKSQKSLAIQLGIYRNTECIVNQVINTNLKIFKSEDHILESAIVWM